MKTDEKNILKNEDVRANLDVKDDVDATHSNVDIETGTKMENTIINEGEVKKNRKKSTITD